MACARNVSSINSGHLKGSAAGNLLYFSCHPSYRPSMRVPFFSILKQFHSHNSTFARNESMVWKAQSVRESFLQPFFQIKSIVTTLSPHHSPVASMYTIRAQRHILDPKNVIILRNRLQKLSKV